MVFVYTVLSMAYKRFINQMDWFHLITQGEQTVTTYTILNSMAKEICRKVSRITKKCEKNQVPYTFNVSDPYTKLVNVDDKSFEVSLVDLNLDVTLKLNGWSSLGIVQRKDGIIQCYFDDASLIAQYKDTDFHCDHCHKNVYRNSITVLENESGERKTVGTSCVKEFTSGLDGNLVAEVSEYMRVLEENSSDLKSIIDEERYAGEFFESNGTRTYDIVGVVSAAKRLIDQYGFESSSSMNATCKSIKNVYDRNRVESEAVDAIEWVHCLSEEELNKSSYLFNLRQIIDAGYCTARHFGFLASLIPPYRKSEYKRLIDLKSSDKKASEYVGNVGDKISVKVTYMNTHTYDTQFGSSHIHLFMDDNGNIFKWSTGNGLGFTVKDDRANYTQWYHLDKSATVQLSGKIKAHDEYHSQKQTVLTRCKCEVLESKERDERIAEIDEHYNNRNGFHASKVEDAISNLM